jgi:hypothetical protein
LLLTQHGVRPEQSLFCVHWTQAPLAQCGVDPLQAAQVAPQWASTSHAVQALAESQ